MAWDLNYIIKRENYMIRVGLLTMFDSKKKKKTLYMS